MQATRNCFGFCDCIFYKKTLDLSDYALDNNTDQTNLI